MQHLFADAIFASCGDTRCMLSGAVASQISQLQLQPRLAPCSKYWIEGWDLKGRESRGPINASSASAQAHALLQQQAFDSNLAVTPSTCSLATLALRRDPLPHDSVPRQARPQQSRHHECGKRIMTHF